MAEPKPTSSLQTVPEAKVTSEQPVAKAHDATSAQVPAGRSAHVQVDTPLGDTNQVPIEIPEEEYYAGEDTHYSGPDIDPGRDRDLL